MNARCSLGDACSGADPCPLSAQKPNSALLPNLTSVSVSVRQQTHVPRSVSVSVPPFWRLQQKRGTEPALQKGHLMSSALWSMSHVYFFFPSSFCSMLAIFHVHFLCPQRLKETRIRRFQRRRVEFDYTSTQERLQRATKLGTARLARHTETAAADHRPHAPLAPDAPQPTRPDPPQLPRSQVRARRSLSQLRLGCSLMFSLHSTDLKILNERGATQPARALGGGAGPAFAARPRFAPIRS